MTISVSDTIKSNLAVNLEDGIALFNEIKQKNLQELTVSFENIKLLSTLFLNESIGKIAIQYPSQINSIKFIIPTSKQIFKLKLDEVIENALMGSEYDTLVASAKTSM